MLYTITKSLSNLKLKILHLRQNLIKEESPLLKLPGIDVLDTSKRIQSWLIKTYPKFQKSIQITQKICDVVSQVTGIEQNSIPAIIYIGLGRAMIKYYNEVLFYLLFVLLQF